MIFKWAFIGLYLAIGAAITAFFSAMQRDKGCGKTTTLEFMWYTLTWPWWLVQMIRGK